MKYFTPELIELGQSTDDNVLDEQERRWEQAGKEYARYVEAVRALFPAGLRRMFNRYYLHDAAVTRIYHKDKYLTIQMQLDTPPHSFLSFRYRLLGEPEINKESLSPSCRSRGLEVNWLYSEIEQLSHEEVLSFRSAAKWVRDEWLDQAGGARGDERTTWPFWVHRILLSNGWELTLFLHDVEIEESENILVAGTPAALQATT